MSARAVATVVAVFAVGFGGFGILAADAANPPAFAAVVNPLKQLPAAGFLEGTSCTSSTHCVVVGLDIGYQPLDLVGDPATWGADQAHEVTLGNKFDEFGFGSELTSISCTSATFCVAVGYDGNIEPLVLAGNPATWTAAQAREITLGGSLSNGFGISAFQSVSCTSSTSCVAVGLDAHFQPLVLAGNPATWTGAQAREIALTTAFGSSGTLDSVSCTSASACVAVGRDRHGQPLALSGDPATWTVAQAHEITLGFGFGSGGGLTSVACTSSTSCVAIGYDFNDQPLSVAGDPSTWGAAQATEITLAHPQSELLSVSCPSASSCVAVGIEGDGVPVVLSGDPSTWSGAQAQEIAVGPAFGSAAELATVGCASASTCVASGIDANNQPFVLAGDPSTWGTAQAREIALGGVQFGVSAYPSSLTCVSSTSCLDVGSSYSVDTGSYLIDGNPATWDQASAVPMTGISDGSFLIGSACPSPTYCVAVGHDRTTHGPVVLVGNPSTWNTATGHLIPLGSAFGIFGALFSVACTSTTSCVAVGVDGHFQPLVLTGDPATWTAANAREIKLGTKFHSGGELESVTCTSATACVAVGFDGYYQQPIVLAGNPSSWTPKQVTLGAIFGYTGALFSVACTSATYCVGVGESGRKGEVPLVVAGDPAHWTATSAFNLKVPSPLPTNVNGFFEAEKGPGYLTSISCTAAGRCVVVGGDNRGAPIYKVGNPKLWKAHPWTSRPAKGGASFATAELTSTSCTPSACFAGGFANGGDFVAAVNAGF